MTTCVTWNEQLGFRSASRNVKNEVVEDAKKKARQMAVTQTFADTRISAMAFRLARHSHAELENKIKAKYRDLKYENLIWLFVQSEGLFFYTPPFSKELAEIMTSAREEQREGDQSRWSETEKPDRVE